MKTLKDFNREKDLPLARSTGSQCSANLNSVAKANGLIIVPSLTETLTCFKPGDIVSVMLFTEI